MAAAPAPSYPGPLSPYLSLTACLLWAVSSRALGLRARHPDHPSVRGAGRRARGGGKDTAAARRHRQRLAKTEAKFWGAHRAAHGDAHARRNVRNAQIPRVVWEPAALPPRRVAGSPRRRRDPEVRSANATPAPDTVHRPISSHAPSTMAPYHIAHIEPTPLAVPPLCDRCGADRAPAPAFARPRPRVSPASPPWPRATCRLSHLLSMEPQLILHQFYPDLTDRSQPVRLCRAAAPPPPAACRWCTAVPPCALAKLGRRGRAPAPGTWHTPVQRAW